MLSGADILKALLQCHEGMNLNLSKLCQTTDGVGKNNGVETMLKTHMEDCGNVINIAKF